MALPAFSRAPGKDAGRAAIAKTAPVIKK